MINKVRLIAKLEIKGENVIKGMRMEGLRKVGKPEELVFKYFNEGIDEIVLVDTVASLYGRNYLIDLVSNTSSKIFIPLTVGGGVRSVNDMEKLLTAGADKVCVNTAAVNEPTLISESSKIFGSSCIVVEIQAKKRSSKHWEVLIENGREQTHLDVKDWCKKVEELGAGEILLTSVDNDGTGLGFDSHLIEEVCNKTNIPIIASGGCAEVKNITNLASELPVNGVCIASGLHFNKITIEEVKKNLLSHNVEVRQL